MRHEEWNGLGMRQEEGWSGNETRSGMVWE